MAGPFVGGTSEKLDLCPIPDANSSALGPTGASNGETLPMDGGSFKNHFFTDAIAPVPSGAMEGGGEISTSVRRVSLPDDGSVDATAIPGSPMRIPKPGY